MRQIEIKERKTKAPLRLIYSRNYEGDEVEKLRLELKSPKILKDYWTNIEEQELERKKIHKVTSITRLTLFLEKCYQFFE